MTLIFRSWAWTGWASQRARLPQAVPEGIDTSLNPVPRGSGGHCSCGDFHTPRASSTGTGPGQDLLLPSVFTQIPGPSTSPASNLGSQDGDTACPPISACWRLWLNLRPAGKTDRLPRGSEESARNTGDAGSIPGSGRFPWRAWQPTPEFFLGKSHGRRSLVGYSPWGRKESDTTEVAEHSTAGRKVELGRICVVLPVRLVSEQCASVYL